MLFQLTTSRRGRRRNTCQMRLNNSTFNSRPHAEVDNNESYRKIYILPFNSRPHAEVDGSEPCRPGSGGLSTHDLTQRSTGLTDGKSVDMYLSTHDLTQRSTIGFPYSPSSEDLSTHDLTQRSTPSACAFSASVRDFQLTTSRRGRQSRCA